MDSYFHFVMTDLFCGVVTVSSFYDLKRPVKLYRSYGFVIEPGCGSINRTYFKNLKRTLTSVLSVPSRESKVLNETGSRIYISYPCIN